MISKDSLQFTVKFYRIFFGVKEPRESKVTRRAKKKSTNKKA